MTITILVALGVAAVSAVVRKSFDFYGSALSWTVRFSIPVILLYVLAGAATGLLGWAFGSWAHWYPQNEWVRGLVWGAFGAALARTGFSAIPAEGATDAISLLSAIGSFLTGALRWGTQRAARTYVDQLDTPAFIRFVSEKWEEGVLADRQLSEDLRIEEATQMSELLEDIESAGADAEIARGRLTAKVVRWVAKYDIPRP